MFQHSIAIRLGSVDVQCHPSSPLIWKPQVSPRTATGICNKLAQPPLPRPSHLWRLNRPPSSSEPAFDIPIQNSLAESLATLANDDMSNGDENVTSILGNDLGMGDLFGGLSDTVSQSRSWPTTSDQASSTATQIPTTSSHDIFSGLQYNIDENVFGTDVDWPWPYQFGDGQGPAP